LAIAVNPTLGPSPEDADDNVGASLTFIDARTGKTRQRISLPAHAADLLAVPATTPPSSR
jgi:hypothetical protein